MTVSFATIRTTGAAVLVAMALSSAAVAQEDPYRLPGSTATTDLAGITVYGRGLVTVPADSAHFVLRLEYRGQEGVTKASYDALGAPIVDALHRHGVPDAMLVYPELGVVGPSSQPAVVGDFAKPTRERAEALVEAVSKDVPDRVVPTLGIASQLSTTLHVDDCGPARARATSAALADARDQALRIAREAGVELGRVVAIQQTTPLPNPCGAKPDAAMNFSGIVQPFNAYGNFEVAIPVTLLVTYAIRYR